MGHAGEYAAWFLAGMVVMGYIMTAIDDHYTGRRGKEAKPGYCKCFDSRPCHCDYQTRENQHCLYCCLPPPPDKMDEWRRKWDENVG